jgi:hypothetical protein
LEGSFRWTPVDFAFFKNEHLPLGPNWPVLERKNYRAFLPMPEGRGLRHEKGGEVNQRMKLFFQRILIR